MLSVCVLADKNRTNQIKSNTNWNHSPPSFCFPNLISYFIILSLNQAWNSSPSLSSNPLHMRTVTLVNATDTRHGSGSPVSLAFQTLFKSHALSQVQITIFIIFHISGTFIVFSSFLFSLTQSIKCAWTWTLKLGVVEKYVGQRAMVCYIRE